MKTSHAPHAEDTTARPPGSTGIIAGAGNRAADKWLVACNQAQNQGTIGAPRVECGDGYVVGSSDLRDSRWHHLAVVCGAGPKANIASHVKVYVDGHLNSGRGSKRR